MSDFAFQPAVKTQAKLRLLVEGGPGDGKTFTALRIARGLVDSRPAVIDTEAGSAQKYADLFGFDVLVLTSYEPQDYINAITAAENAGYEVVVVDSLTHEWEAVKADVDRRKTGERNQFTAWKEPKLAHNKLVEKIMQSRIHVIATVRSKVDYALDTSSGRTEVKKLGMAPIQQDEMPYHFDVIGSMDQAHNMRISKSRIAALADKVIEKPGEELGKKLRSWLSEGAPAPVPPAAPASASTSMGVNDPKQVERVQGLIKAALQTPEESEERKRLTDAKAYLALAGYDNFTLGIVPKLSPAQLAMVEDVLLNGIQKEAPTTVGAALPFDPDKVPV